MRTPVSGASSPSGIARSSPSSTVGGWPRSVGNDRSGLVVFSADPNVDTAAIKSSGSAVVVTVAAGRRWCDRAPTNTSVSPSNASSTRSNVAETESELSTRR
ncbi:hypothetical protein [Halomicrococcus sp. NG-SE-24]|uniref:hypothetical protein n=1 Tax=Halomicrococcus sp. NG-SE-24 TaxID=3436928 RepID=UPI003D959FB2